MKLVLKNCSLLMQGLKRTEIESIYNRKATAIVYPGKYVNSGFCQCWIYPLEKGATYELSYIGSVAEDTGSVRLCSVCKLNGNYSTVPQEGVEKQLVFSWNKDLKIQGGKFTVETGIDADCIVVTGLNDAYDPKIVVKLFKIGE